VEPGGLLRGEERWELRGAVEGRGVFGLKESDTGLKLKRLRLEKKKKKNLIKKRRK
jgi:hypothetical protein